MSSPTLSQKLTAEALGTAILVFIGAGSVPLTVFLTGKNPFGSAELSTISFAFAFAIFAAVYSVGHISGCHINPAVTVALWATRKIDSQTAITYILAQLVGAFIGAAHLPRRRQTGGSPAARLRSVSSTIASRGVRTRPRQAHQPAVSTSHERYSASAQLWQYLRRPHQALVYRDALVERACDVGSSV